MTLLDTPSPPSEGAQDDREIGIPPLSKSGMGICLQNPIFRRLVEAASVQIDLTPLLLDPDSLDDATLCGLELIVADESVARRIRQLLTRNADQGELVNPALLTVSPYADVLESSGLSHSAPTFAERVDDEEAFDGILHLPQTPVALAAQLSVILYANRAFAIRYQPTLDELHLTRRIFRFVTTGISISSANLPDMPLTYVNPAFEVMTGYCLEEVVGKNCRFLQNDFVDQAALVLLRQALANRTEVTVVLKNFRKDGTPFWNELSLSPIRNREGEVTHFVGIQNDVTARVEFEAALRESEKLAAVGRLASTIAHEINNPLESVMNLVYLAQRSDTYEESQAYLVTADRELQRVKLITSQSLRFYKQSSKAQAIGCTELLTSVFNLYQSRLMNGHITLERRDKASQPIVCLESEVRQVLNNLVSNAIDAMYGKGGRLVIRTREGTEWRTNRRGVIFTIADTGSGMSPEVIKSIYKAFYTTKGIGGTGLGLWISSEIVQRHQGRLIVRSTQRAEKSGTVFQLFLPHQATT